MRAPENLSLSHLPGSALAHLPELAPGFPTGCRGFAGPVPPPLWMSVQFNCNGSYASILTHVWQIAYGRWHIAYSVWPMADGGWRTAYGGRLVDSVRLAICYPLSAICYMLCAICYMPALGFQRNIRTAATRAMAAPNIKGAEGPKPFQVPAPCHSSPAMSDAGNAMIPTTAL